MSRPGRPVVFGEDEALSRRVAGAGACGACRAVAVGDVGRSVGRDLDVAVYAEAAHDVNRNRRAEGRAAVEADGARGFVGAGLRAVVDAVRIERRAARERRRERAAAEGLVVNARGDSAALTRNPLVAVVEGRGGVCVGGAAARAS